MPGRWFSEWRAAIRTVPRLLHEGGLSVSTPDGQAEPAIRTVIQLDGDSLNYVSANLLRDYPATQARAELLREHLDRVSAALPRQPDLGPAAWGVVTAATLAVQSGLFAVRPGNTAASIGLHLGGLATLGLRRVAVWLLTQLLRVGAGWMLRRAR